MRGVKFFYYFGVLGYVVMIEKLPLKGTSFGRNNDADEEFLQRH